MSQENTVTESQMKSNMDAMYRWTRYVYDASRKYYLLGRDRALDRINLSEKNILCEVGSGTARNLIRFIQKSDSSTVYGIDASDEMLKTARASVEKRGLSDRIQLAQGFAQSFSAEKQFGLEKPFDRFLFSYSLSIIPPWKESLDHAIDILPAGGEIVIVDFGSMSGHSAWFRKFIFWWLKMFHVYYKPEIEAHLKSLDEKGLGTLEIEQLYGGYCYIATFKKA